MVCQNDSCPALRTLRARRCGSVTPAGLEGLLPRLRWLDVTDCPAIPPEWGPDAVARFPGLRIEYEQSGFHCL